MNRQADNVGIDDEAAGHDAGPAAVTVATGLSPGARRERIAGAVLLVLCTLVYLSFSLPWYIDAPVVMALILVAVRSTWRELALVLASLVVAATVLQLTVSAPGIGLKQFYREQEKWQRADEGYMPNVVDRISVPHGDLMVIDPTAPASIVDPREQEFYTDSLGYRNRADYSGQKVVMVGDSFAVATSVDQKDTLPEVLTNEFDMPTYSIAYPSGPASYERRAQAFLPRMAPDAVFAFMIFEGNDFTLRHPPRVGTGFDRGRARLLSRNFRFLKYPRVIYGMSRRAQEMFGLMGGSHVEVHMIGRRAVGFYQTYILAALEHPVKYEIAGNADVLARTGCVFFIPDKYRVYREYLQDGRALPEPPPGLIALKDYYEPRGIKVVDLTPAMRDAARALLPQDRYVFYRDDTHWNDHGIRAVAPAVSACLRGRVPQ
jgi:hypothetical protein